MRPFRHSPRRRPLKPATRRVSHGFARCDTVPVHAGILLPFQDRRRCHFRPLSLTITSGISGRPRCRAGRSGSGVTRAPDRESVTIAKASRAQSSLPRRRPEPRPVGQGIRGEVPRPTPLTGRFPQPPAPSRIAPIPFPVPQGRPVHLRQITTGAPTGRDGPSRPSRPAGASGVRGLDAGSFGAALSNIASASACCSLLQATAASWRQRHSPRQASGPAFAEGRITDAVLAAKVPCFHAGRVFPDHPGNLSAAKHASHVHPVPERITDTSMTRFQRVASRLPNRRK